MIEIEEIQFQIYTKLMLLLCIICFPISIFCIGKLLKRK